MIIQTLADRFIMIAQHDHAAISGLMAKMWKDTLLADHDKRPSLEYAVRNHDIGWKHMDDAPIWNDDKTAPYTFTDYPTAHKTVFYHFGIEEVAQTDHYAALLCSRHYVRFLRKNMSLAAQTFIQKQEEWSKRIIGTLSDFNRDNYDYHYGILQMLDDISLFMCLNEPGTTGDDLHPFFKNGINKHEAITAIPDESLDIYWNDARAICLDPFPFVDTFKVHLKRRTIMKTMIEQKGLIDSYWNAPLETIDINVTPV